MSKIRSTYCNDGCFFGHGCGGIPRAEVIEHLCEDYGYSLRRHFEGCTDDQLDDLARSSSDEDSGINHIRRSVA